MAKIKEIRCIRTRADGTWLIVKVLTDQPGLSFQAFPRFASEVFAYLHSDNTAQFKRFREGLEQLLQEGVVQVLKVADSATRVPLLGAVGPLQFDVVQYRLKSEYGADSRLERTDWTLMRWTAPAVPREAVAKAVLPTGTRLAEDEGGRTVVLFTTEWSLGYFAEKNPSIALTTIRE